MHELRLLAPQALVEPVSDALIDECGALAVSVEDADANGDAADACAEVSARALYGEPGLPPPAAGWPRSLIRALFADAAAADEAAARWPRGNDRAAHGATVDSIAAVPEQDWVRITQAQFEPIAITPDFWIVPSWHQAPAAARCVLRLDPGLAFGTGAHPTTRLCLRWIASDAHAGRRRQRVLDYGSGSGILAIAAALLGAARVDAVDLDPQAVRATRQNAAANGVCLSAGPPEQAAGGYDLVVANILSTPLKLLAPLLAGHVAEGGELLLSGILERQANELIEAYAPSIALAAAACDDGWVLLHGARPSGGRR